MLIPIVLSLLHHSSCFQSCEGGTEQVTSDVHAPIILPQALGLVGLATSDDLIAFKTMIVCLPGRAAPDAHLIAPAARAVLLLAWLP